MGKVIDVEKSVIFGKKIENLGNSCKIEYLKKSLDYLNKEGYFSDCENFSDYKEDILTSVLVGDDVEYPYKSMNYQNFNYFIPKNNVVFKEEPKLRPYKDIEEFKTETKKYFSISDTLLIRERKTGCVSELLYCGYTVVAVAGPAVVDCGNTVVDHENKEYIHLGSNLWTLEKLSNYDFCINDTTDWFAFGVEE